MSELVQSNIFSRVSDYAYKNKNFLLLTFLLPPLAWLGIIYLLYLAYELIQSHSKKILLEGINVDKKKFSFFKDGFIVAGLSPKAWIFFAAIFGATIPPLPEFDMGSLMTVLMGMLGLGGLRTFEKYKKVAK